MGRKETLLTLFDNLSCTTSHAIEKEQNNLYRNETIENRVKANCSQHSETSNLCMIFLLLFYFSLLTTQNQKKIPHAPNSYNKGLMLDYKFNNRTTNIIQKHINMQIIVHLIPLLIPTFIFILLINLSNVQYESMGECKSAQLQNIFQADNCQ